MPLPAAHITLPGTGLTGSLKAREGVSENCRRRAGFPGTQSLRLSGLPRWTNCAPMWSCGVTAGWRLPGPLHPPPPPQPCAGLIYSTDTHYAQNHGPSQWHPSDALCSKTRGMALLGNSKLPGQKRPGQRPQSTLPRPGTQTSPLGLQARRPDPEGERAANTHQDTPTSTTPLHSALPAF